MTKSVTIYRSSSVIPSSFACRAVAWRRRVIRASPRISHLKRGWRFNLYAASAFVAAFLSIFGADANGADNIGVLGSNPKWNVLENYQRTIIHDEFAHLINDVYCTHGIPDDLIKIDSDTAQIVTNCKSHSVFTLHFAPDANSKTRIPRLWRPAKALSPAKPNEPLLGLRIALDPGHLGGKWAKMEERWFQVGETKPVTEGDLT